MKNYLTLTVQEKIADVLDNNLTGSERTVAYLYIKALRNNNRETIVDFESYYGGHNGARAIILNYLDHQMQKKFGYHVFVFNEHGWAENVKWKTVEKINLIPNKNKKQLYSFNHIKIAEAANGAFAYSVTCDSEAGGGSGYAPSTWGDLFQSKAEAIKAACKEFVDWHTRMKTELLDKAIKATNPYLAPPKFQQLTLTL